ncbi:hypothetical protein CPB97_009425 [Podila verticillata]|nr:hypothetical protein CPB97_009425 [Podila verticillata]
MSSIDNRLSVGSTQQHTKQSNPSQRMIQTRPRSQANYSNYFPPPPPQLSTSAPSDMSRMSGLSSNAFSTTSNSSLEPSSDHNLSADARFQNWRQPAHRSKLSKQYTPSETEDSDEESADIKRRSRFLSGAAIELNSDSAENLRAMSQLSVSSSSRPATPSESADSESVKSATKKISFGKRISKLFGAGNKKALSTPSLSTSSSSSSTSTSPTSSNIRASSSTISLGPIMEQPGLDHDTLEAPRANSLYMHARSHSTPDQIGEASLAQYARMEESRLRKARDSGFEDGRGQRRYSGSTVPTMSSPGGASPRHSPLLGPQRHIQPSAGNRSSILRPEPMCIEQAHQGYRHSLVNAPSSPQLRAHMDPSSRLSRDGQRSPMLRPTTPMEEQPRARRTTVTDYPMSHSPQHSRNSFMGAEAMPRRSSTPTHVSETLISKVDRESASVCFQSPSAKRDSFTRDANLDPALSNLVQQHRKDFKTNQRLGGTPTPVHPNQNYHPHHSHFQRHSPRLSAVHSEESPMIRDPSARRDSSGSQHHYYPHGLAPELTPAQMKRLSTGSQHHVPMRSSPKRQSSAGYFTPAHIHPHSGNMEQPPLLHISPFPSPSLGAVATSSYIPDMSLAVQQQQLDQLQQIRIHQQQVLLQQQQHLQNQLQQSRAGIAPLPMMTPMGMGIMVNNGSGTLTPLLVNPSTTSTPLYTYPVHPTGFQ